MSARIEKVYGDRPRLVVRVQGADVALPGGVPLSLSDDQATQAKQRTAA